FKFYFVSSLLILPPPISTLFPYTTLFRSHVRGLVGSFGDLAAVQVRDKCSIPRFGETVGGLLDLVVEPPIFLNADKARRVCRFGVYEISRTGLPVRPPDLNHFTHAVPPEIGRAH